MCNPRYLLASYTEETAANYFTEQTRGAGRSRYQFLYFADIIVIPSPILSTEAEGTRGWALQASTGTAAEALALAESQGRVPGSFAAAFLTGPGQEVMDAANYTFADLMVNIYASGISEMRGEMEAAASGGSYDNSRPPTQSLDAAATRLIDSALVANRRFTGGQLLLYQREVGGGRWYGHKESVRPP